MQDIRNFTQEELTTVVCNMGEPKFRAKQIFEWIHLHHATSYDEMTNLPKALREKLEKKFPLFEPKIINKQTSEDGTRKYVIEFENDTMVECVGIVNSNTSEPSDSAIQKNKERITVCFSTQAGCRMQCKFCATGQQEFDRDLTGQEMLDQIVVVQKDFQNTNKDARINNVVAMGQGEPFLNYDNLIDGLEMINSPEGLNIGARHITVSTSGIIDGILRFTEEPEQYRLAVSLHSAIQEVRDKIMPRLANQPLNRLRNALVDYCVIKHRRITLEYMLIKGVNDRNCDLDALIAFCEGLLCHVNLIPFNPVSHSSYKTSSHETLYRWEGELSRAGIPASIRFSKGADIAGACGQLKNQICE